MDFNFLTGLVSQDANEVEIAWKPFDSSLLTSASLMPVDVGAKRTGRDFRTIIVNTERLKKGLLKGRDFNWENLKVWENSKRRCLNMQAEQCSFFTLWKRFCSGGIRIKAFKALVSRRQVAGKGCKHTRARAKEQPQCCNKFL